MKKYGFIFLMLAVAVYLYGCGKKQQTLEEMQAPMDMESLSMVSPTTAQTTAVPQTEIKLEQLPPSGSFKPTVGEIQTALKNAGFYAGAIDNKMGPLTKKAIEEFQKVNGLQVDGKVGRKTWTLLNKYLNPQATTISTSATGKKSR